MRIASSQPEDVIMDKLPCSSDQEVEMKLIDW